MGWYAVRCLFRVAWGDHVTGTAQEGVAAYEERITLWQAKTHEEAIVLAEQEADEYAAAGHGMDAYLGLAQAFQLFDEPGHGAEVFSLIRESRLDSETYLDTFFDTGDERQGGRSGDPLA